MIWTAVALATKPAPGMFVSVETSRKYECERLSVEVAHDRYPGRVRKPTPRGDYMERSALACRELLMRPGLRGARDEAVLWELTETVDALVSVVTASFPHASERTWLVDVNYPNATLVSKIAFASKNALMGKALPVSDRTPALGAGDIDVLTRLPPEEAYPAACSRYVATGAVGPRDVLLNLMVWDLDETALHAGLCTVDGWMWVR